MKSQSNKNKWNASLLGTQNAKTSKGEDLGYLTGILYLAPARISIPYGGKNICPYASQGCELSCLFTAGHGKFTSTQQSRIAKTLCYLNDKDDFFNQLRASIEFVARKAKREGLTPCFRLNGTSDIGWHKTGIFDEYPDYQFYDYTKGMNRCFEKMPKNYHLTFSRSESNEIQVERVINETSINVAAVFNTKKGKDLPKTYMGRTVIDADLHDLRFLDPKGVICGLRAKGDGKKDNTGFVINA
jgi:hypothetical protein